MNLRRSGSLRAVLLLGNIFYTNAAPSPAQSNVLHVYLNALVARNYDKAYAQLAQRDRAYFHNARNFASVFESAGLHLQSYTVIAARGNESQRLFFVKERFFFLDFARNRRASALGTLPYGVLREHRQVRVRDSGHPWKALVCDATSQTQGVRVAVRKLAFFPKYVQVLITFVHAGDGFVTILPYRKSVLSDDGGAVYPIIEAKDWRITDRELFLGLRIAANAQYTGFLNFEIPLRRSGRYLHLEIAPLIRDGGQGPFRVSLPPIDASGT